MAMTSGVFAPPRAWTFRLGRGSLERMSTSRIGLTGLAPAESIRERCVAEARKCLQARGDVEMAVGDGRLPRRRPDVDGLRSQRHDHLGHLVERGRHTRGHVEHAPTPMGEREAGRGAEVVDEYVIAHLLAATEEADRL